MDITPVCCVTIYILLEIYFYIYVHFFLLPTIVLPRSREMYSGSEAFQVGEKCINIIKRMKMYNFRDFIKGWFLNAEIESIHTENLHSWLSWILYGCDSEDLSFYEKQKVISFRLEMCETFDITFKDGFNPDVRHCRFSLEKLTTMHHLLLEYVLFNIFECRALFYLIYNGFSRTKTTGGIHVWYKKNEKSSSNRPLLFLHGICSGWSSYIECIHKFGKDRDVILIDYSCVRISWIHLHVPNKSEIYDCINEIFEKFKIQKVSLLAHSWGTLIATWLLERDPSIFTDITLIDPVGLVIFLPEPTYILMYKPPTTLLDFAICYFVRHNINTANAMYRNLFWCNVTCFLDDIPKNIPILIGTGTDDDLVSSNAIKDLVNLTNQNRSIHEFVTLITFEKYKHGDILSKTDSIDKLYEAKRRQMWGIR